MQRRAKNQDEPTQHGGRMPPVPHLRRLPLVALALLAAACGSTVQTSSQVPGGTAGGVTDALGGTSAGVGTSGTAGSGATGGGSTGSGVGGAVPGTGGSTGAVSTTGGAGTTGGVGGTGSGAAAGVSGPGVT